jgi:hypothetical protein
MKKFKLGCLNFATDQINEKYYVYDLNGMGWKLLGAYDSKIDVLVDYPTAEFETIEEARTFLKQ